VPISYSVFFIFYFLFFILILYQVFIVTVQEPPCSASYGINKTSMSKTKKQTKINKIISNSCQVLDTSPSHG